MFLGLMAVVLLVGMLYTLNNKDVAPTTGIVVTPQAGVSGCEYTPAITYAGFNEYLVGTSVGVTAYTKVDSDIIKTGVTSANPGQSLKVLLVNDTTYHNAVVEKAVTCLPNIPVSTGLKANASITVSMYNTDGDKMTNAGGVNQTVATGGTYNLKIRMDGQDKASTNDMVCILEASDKAKFNNVILNGFSAVKQGEVPSFYTLGGVGASTFVYTVAPIEGANSYEGIIQVSSKSGQSLATEDLTISCYTKEYFLGADGNIQYDVEDTSATSSTSTFMAKYSYQIFFQ